MRLRLPLLVASIAIASSSLPRLLQGQIPGVPQLPGGVRPTPEQVQQLLQSRPDLVELLRQRINASGLTPDQIRARLRAAGYPENMLDQYLPGADTTGAKPAPAGNTLEALRTLGLVNGQDAESLLVLSDSAQHVADSLRADSLAAAADTTRGLKIFGLSLFRQSHTVFLAPLSGPVGENYRLGPGDGLVLILTGDVEQTQDLQVSREGFVVIPQVGQIYVANLTLAQLTDVLYTRLGKVYSGVRRGPRATTHFSVTVSQLRQVQVVVTGDATRPGSYQLPATGTTLGALYVAGGPTERGSFRRIQIRRNGKLIDSLDIYDYLLRGDDSHDVRLETGDVVFVPVRETQVKVVGRVVRPGIYELKHGESLPDLIAAAGGFEPDALRRRVQIDRILPPRERGASGRDRVVLDLSADQFESENDPPLPLEPGDSVTVFAVADRVRDMISVWGPVWTQGPIGFTTGMHLSDAIRLAGGPKPEVYQGLIQISRLLPDSSRIQLHSSLRDSTGAVTEDLPLVEDDSITLFSRTEFRPLRYVAVTGAVHNAGRVDFHEGMTLRDALLEVGGLTEDALLSEVEIARLPDDTSRGNGRVAETVRVPLDSSYVFERAPNGRYIGPPGLPAPASGGPEATLRPYDNILVLRQPDWEFQRTVAITGQVRYPGRYGLLKRTDRLTDLVRRAGGLSKEAYPQGIQFFRSQDRTGRIGVNLARALQDSTDRDNLILAGGDSIFIPEYNPVVMVNGLVNAPQAVNYNPGKDIEYYISGAGGYHRNADKGRAYVTQPSGKVQSVHRRFLLPDSKPEPLPGATVFVPIKDTTFRHDWLAVVGPVVQALASITTIIVVLRK